MAKEKSEAAQLVGNLRRNEILRKIRELQQNIDDCITELRRMSDEIGILYQIYEKDE